MLTQHSVRVFFHWVGKRSYWWGRVTQLLFAGFLKTLTRTLLMKKQPTEIGKNKQTRVTQLARIYHQLMITEDCVFTYGNNSQLHCHSL